MSKLVSLLMPSTNPIAWVEKALDSVKRTASDYSQVEVLLRVDNENQERRGQIDYLVNKYGAKYYVGPRFNGYNSMGTYIDELLAMARGRWCWLFDDDAWLEGATWQQQLEQIPCHQHEGPAVQCEFYKLGPSLYSENLGPVGMLLPTAFAKQVKHSFPVDGVWIDRVTQAKWKIVPLKDTTYCHNGRVR